MENSFGQAKALAVSLAVVLGTVFGPQSVANTAAEDPSREPTPAEILSQVQTTLRTKTNDTSSAACHPGQPIRSDSKLVARLLSMTPSNIRDFKYFKADGIAEEILLGDHPRILLHLWVLTKAGACDQFEFWEIVS